MADDDAASKRSSGSARSRSSRRSGGSGSTRRSGGTGDSTGDWIGQSTLQTRKKRRAKERELRRLEDKVERHILLTTGLSIRVGDYVC